LRLLAGLVLQMMTLWKKAATSRDKSRRPSTGWKRLAVADRKTYRATGAIRGFRCRG